MGARGRAVACEKPNCASPGVSSRHKSSDAPRPAVAPRNERLEESWCFDTDRVYRWHAVGQALGPESHPDVGQNGVPKNCP